jgi:hypothetical protein
MKTHVSQTRTVRLYLSGPIEVAKQAIRADTLRAGLCVTIEPTTYIYTGGEEAGYVVGLLNYPRFPCEPHALDDRARDLMHKLLTATHQHSALMVTPECSEWITVREQQAP